MTKEEVYNLVINFQLKTGQGLSGITTAVGNAESQSIKRHLETLIEEGLVVKSSSGASSIGHPSGSDWYMPSKGYNVWEDKRGLKALEFIRLYLGISEEKGDAKCKRDDSFMIEYDEWIIENRQALQEMLELKQIEFPPTSTEFVIQQLKKEEVEFLIKLFCYTDNKNIVESLEDLKDLYTDYKKMTEITQKLDNLLIAKNDFSEASLNEILKNKKLLDDASRNVVIIQNLIDLLQGIDKTLPIQLVFSKAIKEQ